MTNSLLIRHSAKVFISYRRKPSAILATFIAKELESRGIAVFVDTRRIAGAGFFADRLYRAIDNCDVFVCLLAESTLESEWVRREISHAHKTGKKLLPVFQESYNLAPIPTNESIKALLDSDGIHVLDIKNIYVDEAINKLVKMIQESGITSSPFPNRHPRRIQLSLVTLCIILLAMVAFLLLPSLRSNLESNRSTSAVSFVPTETLAGGGRSQIAFTSNREGNAEIYLMSLDRSVVAQRLTNNPASDDFPSWSPDGSRLAFVSNRDGNFEIYIMTPEGTDLVNLTTNPGNDFYPTWLYDGSSIAFMSDRDGDFDLYLMNTDGTNVVNLTNSDTNEYDPAWSPNGLQIVFTSEVDDNREIYLLGITDRNLTNLTRNSAWDEVAAWSPSGTRIAFASTRDVNHEIYIMNADGANPTNVTNDAAQDYEPSWSPDGTQIAFTSNRNGDEDIYILSLSANSVVDLTNNRARDYDPAWRP